MNEGLALLNAILDDPDDDLRRLAYADHLDENDQPERARFIRAHVYNTRHGTPIPPDAMITRDGVGVRRDVVCPWWDESWFADLRWELDRGFVGSLIGWDIVNWLRFADRLLARHPIRRVQIVGDGGGAITSWDDGATVTRTAGTAIQAGSPRPTRMLTFSIPGTDVPTRTLPLDDVLVSTMSLGVAVQLYWPRIEFEFPPAWGVPARPAPPPGPRLSSILEAIRANPADDTPRLMCADYLAARAGLGDDTRSEFIRAQVEIGWLEAKYRRPQPRAENREWESDVACAARLLARERYLLDTNGPYRLLGLSLGDLVFGEPLKFLFTIEEVRSGADRGFFDSLPLTAYDWQIYEDVLRRRFPVRRVRLKSCWAPLRTRVNPDRWEFAHPSTPVNTAWPANINHRPLERVFRHLKGGRGSSNWDKRYATEDEARADLKNALETEWPGIEFELPPASFWEFQELQAPEDLLERLEARLAEVERCPRPVYQLDGRRLTYEEYVYSLRDQVDQTRARVARMAG